jgi:choline dehydrogenase-like flavoprotein
VFGSLPEAWATGLPRSFAAMDLAVRRTMVGRWIDAPLPLARTVLQAFRRLTLGAYAASPAGAAALGVPGPFHKRGPLEAWEGALSGDEEGLAQRHRDIETSKEGGSPPARGPVARAPIVLRVVDPRPRLERLPRGVSVAEQRDLPSERPPVVHRDADVVVVGSGAGGGLVAARLAEAGWRVIVLERGGWHGPDDYDEDEAASLERLYGDGGLRATEDLSVTILQGETAGGGTTVNWLMMLRATEAVRAEWRTQHGLDLSDAEWDAAYDRIEAEVGATEVPEAAHSANNRKLLEGARSLGWAARAGKANAKGCVRCGNCGIGCRQDARRGGLAVYLPRALAAGAEIHCDTEAVRVERLEAGRRGKKRVHAVVRDPTTRNVLATMEIDAPTVVLAGGAVGTPVLLERSGLGGGGVGRYLRLHPTTAMLGRYDEPIVPSAGMPMTVHVDHFGAAGPNGYGFWVQCPPLLPVLGAIAAPGWGEAHAGLLRQHRHMGAFIGLTRDGADGGSSGSVTLRGDGSVRIRYRPSAADTENIVDSMVAAARLHLAAGALEVFSLHNTPVRVTRTDQVGAIRAAGWSPNRCGLFSAHVNGTCRVGTDPLTSGALPTGERHGAPGIYVVDGSLLPTGVGVNPQATILALADCVVKKILAGQ